MRIRQGGLVVAGEIGLLLWALFFFWVVMPLLSS